ncbi:MAG TPA: ferrous iron transport protein A [Pyrodictium sp.]|nr:ferrous iron transport protein A [Pyrodictium sp.]HIQ56110.1 ferrous iron transport protein A [Pyrodictium sp.]
MVPLSLLPTGSRARIVDIRGGYGFRRKLFEMGLTPDTIVEVLANSRGPILVRVRGTVIAIGRGMAHKILVEPL